MTRAKAIFLLFTAAMLGFGGALVALMLNSAAGHPLPGTGYFVFFGAAIAFGAAAIVLIVIDVIKSE